jgi:hypothetical protein
MFDHRGPRVKLADGARGGRGGPSREQEGRRHRGEQQQRQGETCAHGGRSLALTDEPDKQVGPVPAADFL